MKTIDSMARLCIIAALTVTTSAFADPINFGETFNHADLVNQMPDDWVIKSSAWNPDTCLKSIQQRVGGDDPQYALLLTRIDDSSSRPAACHTAYFTGDLGQGMSNGQITDVTGSVMMQRYDGDNTSMGVVVRAGELSYEADGVGYFIGAREGFVGIWGGTYGEGKNALGSRDMRRPDYEDNNYPVPLAYSDLELDEQAYSISDGIAYRLEFSAIGSTLEASVYLGEQLLGTVSYTCGTSDNDAGFVEAGYFGLRSTQSNSTSGSYLWDLQASAIPEPATLSLLGLGGLMIRMRRPRMRAR